MISLYLNIIDNEQDKDKFEQLYLTYKHDMYAVAYHILYNQFDAEDAVHDAFIRIAKNIEVVIISIFIAGTTTILSVEAIREKVFGFFIEIFEKFSIIQYDGEEDAPESIENIYEITDGMEGYTLHYEEQTDFFISKIYVKEEIVIDYFQWTKGEYKQNWNTEDAEIEHIEINGYKAIIFTDNHNYNHIIWEDQDYVFTLSTNLGENALIEMAKSVQKVE